MKKENNTPSLRFQGFEGEWEERKLGDVCNITTGKLDANAMVIDGQYDFYTSGKEIYKIDKAAFEGPAITIAGNGASVGYTHLADGKFNAYQRTYVLTEFTEERLFLHEALALKLPLKILEEVRGSGIPYIVQNLLTDLVLLCPSRGEQISVGSFLTFFDKHIFLQQQKLNKLEVFKKAMLEKMFPQKGSRVPEIRFGGFTEPWEENMLEDIVDVHSGKDYKHLSAGSVPVYGTGGYMLSVNKALSFADDAIGIGRKGTIDKPFILRAPFWTVDTLFFVIPRQQIDLSFMFAMFQNIEWEKKDESTGVPSLSKVAITGVNVLRPSYAEQQRIGLYFASIDRLISLQELKVTKLQGLKKALLERMFPLA